MMSNLGEKLRSNIRTEISKWKAKESERAARLQREADEKRKKLTNFFESTKKSIEDQISSGKTKPIVKVTDSNLKKFLIDSYYSQKGTSTIILVDYEFWEEFLSWVRDEGLFCRVEENYIESFHGLERSWVEIKVYPLLLPKNEVIDISNELV